MTVLKKSEFENLVIDALASVKLTEDQQKIRDDICSELSEQLKIMANDTSLIRPLRTPLRKAVDADVLRAVCQEFEAAGWKIETEWLTLDSMIFTWS